MKKLTGIWLDFAEANIIHLADGDTRVIDISSDIEDYHLAGGSRSKTPWGPMDKTSESKLLERRKHQTAHYYAAIAKTILESDAVFIMGPAEAKTGLNTYLKEKHPGVNIKEVQSADKMTENQKVAAVKAFFKQ